MKKYLVLISILLTSLGGIAQRVNISFLAMFQGKPIQLEQPIITTEKDTIQINQLKFYISNIQFLQEEKMVYAELNSYHLVDFSLPSSTSLSIKTFEPISFNSISFQLGIDSITNVSGALGGDLDPTHGMYWTWQSGYINFKMEGQASQREQPAKDFQFHLGGYQQPFVNLQKVKLNVSNETINITLNLDPFINSLDLSKIDHIMSPSKKAVELSELLAKNFKIK